jgi:hypothetical protein
MRIRAVRPDFWQDDKLGHLSDAVRLFYIGLWCVSDDAGWLEWRPSQLGASLYPYRGAARRERDIEGWGDILVQTGRIVRHPCGCAFIPTLVKHQRAGGNPTYQYREKHRYHTSMDESVPVRTDTSLEGREGKESKGMGGSGGTDWETKITEMRRRGQGA